MAVAEPVEGHGPIFCVDLSSANQAAAQAQRARTMEGIVTIIALIVGPVAAVCITLWYQRRTEKRAAKERLFMTLMAHRRSFPPPPDWTNALNLIDVVYADSPIIVSALAFSV